MRVVCHVPVARCVQPRGVTLLETLLVIAVIGILVSMAMVAIQAAREASRRNGCVANLHQLGLAVATYEGASKCFPPGLSYGASLHVALLPQLGLQPLYDELRPRFSGGSIPTALPRVSTFLCPSDGAVVFEGGAAGTNYTGNSGTWWPRSGWDGIFIYWNEYAYKDRVGPVRAADVLDGLSNTHAISELLRADNGTHRMRVRWTTPTFYSDIDALAHACRSIPADPPAYGWKGNQLLLGVPWSDGNIGSTLNNHVLGPNQPSCENGGGIVEGAYSSASNHSGGVNALFADGHVSFVSNGIDLGVWRSAASRAGASF